MRELFESTQALAYAPLPPSEAALPTLLAEPWLEVSTEFLQLEGLCFDRFGNLYFLEVFGGSIFKLPAGSKNLEVIYVADGLNPASIKIHKDGRLYVCCLGDFNQGLIFSIDSDGQRRKDLISGYVADDLVFARDGSFYFTHFTGAPSDPTGGVYYASSDCSCVTPIVERMAGPNGIALSTDEKMLWVTETNANRLHLVQLSSHTKIAPYGTSIPYYFTGFHGPDSCSIDAQDNLYVAMYGQGRVLIFNRFGFPIGQVLIPGREEGHFLRSTHPMMIPGTSDLLICTNDFESGRGSWIFKSKGFAQAYKGFQFS